MRDKMDFVLFTESTARIDVPGQFIRLVMLSFDVAGATVGERPRLDFLVNGAVMFSVAAGPLAAAASVVSFALGGAETAGLTTVGDSLVTGVLPDIWWGPDLAVEIDCQMFGAGTFANLRFLREVKLIDGGRGGRR